MQAGGCGVDCRCDTLANCPGHLEGIRGISLREGASVPGSAGVAQSVEHLICNQRVGGSNPFASSRKRQDETNFPLGGGLGSGATGFSNALQSEIFRRVVIFAQSLRAILGFPALARADW